MAGFQPDVQANAVLSSEVIALVKSQQTVKVIATSDGEGVPHVVVKATIGVNDRGNLTLVELIESSATGRNLVRSIWYERTVSILAIGGDGHAVQIKGIPERAHVRGPVYRAAYEVFSKLYPGTDPAAVWEIRPIEVIDQSWQSRLADENRKHPYFLHLDKIAKKSA